MYVHLEGKRLNLEEIGNSYQAEIKRGRAAAARMRRELKTVDDPEKRAVLKMRIRALNVELTQLRMVQEICLHYYEPDYYRPEEISSNCFSGRKKNI